MRARIGIWHDAVALFLREQGYVPLSISLERNKDDSTRLFVSEHTGSLPWLHFADAEELTDFPYIIRTAREESDGFTRCRVMSVELMPHLAGWTVDLPPDHELPWPKCRTCASYNAPEELFKEAKKRQASAIRSGVRPPPPPGDIQMKFTPAMRLELFNGNSRQA